MNGIQIKYAELFRLSVEQLFYQNKLYKQTKISPEPDMRIIPTEECMNVMNRLDMIFKTIVADSGILLLARVSGTNSVGDDITRFSARKDDILTFLLLLNNHDVVNFNDLPVQPEANKVYYFNNEVNDLAAERTDLHLSKNAAGVDGTSDVIKTSTENYRFHHTAVVAKDTAQVKHILSGQFVTPVAIVNQGGQSDLTFNLSALPMGKCELLINNISLEQFYYVEKYKGQNVFGIIELSLASTLAANYRIIEPDRSLIAQKPFYTITFINRKTIWRYTIRLQNTSQLFLEMANLSPADKEDFISKLNITTNDGAITFSKDTVTDKEFVFVSNNPVSLQEKYFSSTSPPDPLSLNLEKYLHGPAADNTVILKSNLPFPPTGSIDGSASPKIYSDIFLTL